MASYREQESSLRETIIKGSDVASSRVVDNDMRDSILKGSDSFSSSLSASIRCGSDSCIEFFCDLCDDDDKFVEAVGFCNDCEDYMCRDCFDTHLKPRSLRQHVLLDEKKMPKDRQQRKRPINCDVCYQDSKIIEASGYCSDCADYLCETCYNAHLIPRPSRHHVLLDRKMMPRDKTRPETKASQRQVPPAYNSRDKPTSLKQQLTLTAKPSSNLTKVNKEQDQSFRSIPVEEVTGDARKVTAKHEMDLNVRCRDDEHTPGITGSVVLSFDRIIVVDSANRKVKLINVKTNTIVFKLDRQNTPLDITSASFTQVAVTCPGIETILLLNVIQKLVIEKQIKMNGHCQCIANVDNNFVVTFERPTKVELLSKTFYVLRTLVPESNPTLLETSFIAISNDRKTVYISNLDTNTVTSFSLDGELKARYEDWELWGPRGLIVDRRGYVYVCKLSQPVQQLSPELKKVNIILRKSDGVESPVSGSYCDKTDRVFFGMCGDNIKVYQLKYEAITNPKSQKK